MIFVGDSATQVVWVLHSTGLYVIREIRSCISVVNKFSNVSSLCFTPDTRELYVPRCTWVVW